jgi:hypothetical protein
MFDGINQQMNEERYSRKHIDLKLRNHIVTTPAIWAKVEHGVQLLQEYMGKTYTYPREEEDGSITHVPRAEKNRRIANLAGHDLEHLVTDIFVGIAYCLKEELFTSVTAKMAGRLRFDNKGEAIVTTAELVGVLCRTDAFDIRKGSKMASLVVQSRIPLSDELIDFIEQSQYLPPMVCEPLPLKCNFDTGYLTHKESLILGSGNHHVGDICLDALNIMNRVPLSLDLDFLCKVEELPSEITVEAMKKNAAKRGKIISDAEAQVKVVQALENWKGFKKQSYRFYKLMADQGNVFYLTHKVDKRGRAYAQGYHITTQGSSFKKAAVELATQEYVTGVPGF